MKNHLINRVVLKSLLQFHNHNHIDAYCGLHNNIPMQLDGLFKNFRKGFYEPGFKK